jgi:formylglycine-generating enzyme required for sulfatase activity
MAVATGRPWGFPFRHFLAAAILATAVLTLSVPAPANDGDDIVNSVGMRFVRIPRGTFAMGSPSPERFRGDDEWLHEVQISRPFYLGEIEVTQRQYQAVMGKNPSFFTATGGGAVKVRPKEAPLLPVECVSWDDAIAFCEALGNRDDERAVKRRYRLPTEAEWEWACRAGSKMAFCYGNSVTSTEANFNGFAPYGKIRSGPFLGTTWTGGAYKANAFGLYDMHGNVAEWCADWYDADYYRRSPRIDPHGPAWGTEHVVRGGGWTNTARSCRSAARHHFPPEFAGYNIGFRVVLIEP